MYVEYLSFFVYQIHFLCSFLRRPHTDRFPNDVPDKVTAEQESWFLWKKCHRNGENRNLEDFCRIRHLAQAGILANKRLRHKLTPFCYYKHVSTPCLWYHKTRPILFTLVVDNFGVKYVNKEDIDHLNASIKTTYTLTKERMGNLYCGICLNWDYKNWTVDIIMPGYVKKKLQEYNHIASKRI